jgi:hypothetical protein
MTIVKQTNKQTNKQQTPWLLVRKRTVPSERGLTRDTVPVYGPRFELSTYQAGKGMSVIHV